MSEEEPTNIIVINRIALLADELSYITENCRELPLIANYQLKDPSSYIRGNRLIFPDIKQKLSFDAEKLTAAILAADYLEQESSITAYYPHLEKDDRIPGLTKYKYSVFEGSIDNIASVLANCCKSLGINPDNLKDVYFFATSGKTRISASEPDDLLTRLDNNYINIVIEKAKKAYTSS